MIKRTEFDNGAEYTLNGNLHREDGPAMELSNGDREWWNNGFLVEAPVSHVPEEKRKTESEDLIYKSPLEPGQKYLLCDFPAAEHVLDYDFMTEFAKTRDLAQFKCPYCQTKVKEVIYIQE